MESVKVSVWIPTQNFEAGLGCHKKVWLLVLVLARKHVHWFFGFTNAARKTQAQTNDTLTKGTRSCDSTLYRMHRQTHMQQFLEKLCGPETSTRPQAEIFGAQALLKPSYRRQRGPPAQPTCVIPVSERIGMRSL